MTNKYLEKIASTALSRHLAATKSNIDRSGATMSAGQLSRQFATGSSNTPIVSKNVNAGRVAIKDKAFATRTEGLAGRNVRTTDSLVTGKNLSDRLKDFKSGAPRKPVTSTVFGTAARKATVTKPGLLNKAVDIVKRNPKLALGGAAALGIGGFLAGRKSKETNYGY